uniref:Protein quiver n=1 Tax=Strigamia maritima TaxID=126957 RepID=T1JCJ9_STRMM
MRPSVMNFLLVAVLFFTCVVQYGAPMKCYKCDTEESCRDKPGNCTTNEGTKFCWKSEATKDGKKIVIKDCNEPPIGKASKSNKCESRPAEPPTVVDTFKHMPRPTAADLRYSTLFSRRVERREAMKCYQCQNENDCKEKPTECDAEKERPYCVKLNGTDENGVGVFIKDCSGLPALTISFPASVNVNDKCKSTVEANGLSHTICICTTNLCNNSNIKYIPFTLIFVAVAVQLIQNLLVMC